MFKQSWEMFEASKANYKLFSEIKRVTSERENHLDVGLMKSTMLLLGLSVENALKGALVYKSKPDLLNLKLNPQHFHKQAHDLNDVAKRLNLGLCDKEEMLLDRLSMFVQWASKYQAPLRQIEYEQTKNEIKLQYPSDFEIAEKLLNTLQLQSGYSIEKGWPKFSS